MADLHAVHRAIAAARRRLWLQRWLDGLGWFLLGGVLAAAALRLADRLLALPVPWPVYVGLATLTVLAAMLLAMGGRPSPDRVAIAVDDRLRLKDKLSTALYATSQPQEPFAAAVIHDAQVAASSAKVREGFPLRLHRAWGWLPVAGTVLALLFVLVKPMDLLGLDAQRQAAQAQAEQAAAARDKIVDAIATLEQVQQEWGQLEEIDPLRAIKEAASLTQRELTHPDYRQKAAAKLSAVQDKLEQAQQQKALEFESLLNALSRLDPGQPGPADRFAQALRRGDFDAARAALQQLAESAADLPADQKQALSQQLETLARQLEEAAGQAQAHSNPSQSNQQAQSNPSQNNQSQDPLQQQMLESQGLSPQQAQQTAQNPQPQAQQSPSQESCGSLCQGLGQSLQQMAQSLSPNSTSQSHPSQQPNPGMQSAAWQSQQQVTEMAKMQQQLQQLSQAQQKTQQAMQQLNAQGQGGGSRQQGQQGAGPGHQGGGVGGREAGTGDGGNPFGTERTFQPDQVDAIGHVSEGEGRIIASWVQQGEAAAGEATVEFNAAVTEARQQAERALADDRVPARYHGAVRQYFQQMPASVDEVKRAPAAPR